MEKSILINTKKILGLSDDYTAFDPDILTHLNATLAILNQLGVGPTATLIIEDVSTEWGDLQLPDDQLGLVKTYLYAKVRSFFDPPTSGPLIDALNRQIEELEWRLSVMRESLLPLPDPPPSLQTTPDC